MTDLFNLVSFSAIGLPLLIVGLVVVVLAIVLVPRVIGARASQNWTPTTARVVASQVRQEQSSDNDGNWQTYYHPGVQYEYVVGGIRYTGDRLSMLGSVGYGSPAQASQALPNYPVGASVTVYYNPQHPDQATLQTGLSLGPSFGKPIVLVVALVVIVGLLVACLPILILGQVFPLFHKSNRRHYSRPPISPRRARRAQS